MGNIEIESAHTFNPTVVQGVTFSNNPSSAGGGGYGLVQWTPGSKLKHYIGNAQPTIANEINALRAQLTGKGPDPETAAGVGFFSARGVSAATIAFHLKYERSASSDSSLRVTAANHWYQQYDGASVTGTTPTITTAFQLAQPCTPGQGPGQAAGGGTGGGTTPASFDRIGNPHTVAQAIAWLTIMARTGRQTPVGMCAQQMAIAYGWPNSGCYPHGGCTALALWYSIPPALKTAGMSPPPRGALVFWHSGNPAGHIAISLGNGALASTDAPGASGRISIVPITRIDRWGPRAGWAAPFWPVHTTSTKGL